MELGMARGFLGNFVYTGGYPHGHATFPVRRTCLFCSCFVQLALRAQTDTKHERQCAPHDGSLATVCGNSRGSGVVHIWRFLKQKMPLILLSDTF